MANNLEPDPVEPPKDGATIAPELRAAWQFSVIQQAAIIFTVIAMQDGKRIYAVLIAQALYWGGIGFIIFLRRSKPILIDLLFARWSFPLLWLAALVVLVKVAKTRVQ